MLNDVFHNTRDKINMVGCGFCLTKWTQVTMHLHNGTTHSCHHPKPHKIPLDEILTNPTALHNTNFKKQIRKEMLEDKRPEECDYCWNIENMGENYTSDRHIRNASIFTKYRFKQTTKGPWDQNINPEYSDLPKFVSKLTLVPVLPPLKPKNASLSISK